MCIVRRAEQLHIHTAAPKLLPCASKFICYAGGPRLRWRDVQNSKTYTGTRAKHLEQRNGEQYGVLELQPSDPMSTERPPPLYEPELPGFATLAFRLRGFERLDRAAGGNGVVQEWHVEAP